MGEEGDYNSEYDGLEDVPFEQRLEGRQGGATCLLGKRTPGSSVTCQSPKSGTGMKRGS